MSASEAMKRGQSRVVCLKGLKKIEECCRRIISDERIRGNRDAGVSIAQQGEVLWDILHLHNSKESNLLHIQAASDDTAENRRVNNSG